MDAWKSCLSTNDQLIEKVNKLTKTGARIKEIIPTEFKIHTVTSAKETEKKLVVETFKIIYTVEDEIETIED